MAQTLAAGRSTHAITVTPGSPPTPGSSNITLSVGPESASWFTSPKNLSTRQIETCYSKIQPMFIARKGNRDVAIDI